MHLFNFSKNRHRLFSKIATSRLHHTNFSWKSHTQHYVPVVTKRSKNLQGNRHTVYLLLKKKMSQWRHAMMTDLKIPVNVAKKSRREQSRVCELNHKNKQPRCSHFLLDVAYLPYSTSTTWQMSILRRTTHAWILELINFSTMRTWGSVHKHFFN